MRRISVSCRTNCSGGKWHAYRDDLYSLMAGIGCKKLRCALPSLLQAQIWIRAFHGSTITNSISASHESIVKSMLPAKSLLKQAIMRDLSLLVLLAVLDRQALLAAFHCVKQGVFSSSFKPVGRRNKPRV